jgi:Endonuclease I/Secretion system C-terminal sorting domain
MKNKIYALLFIIVIHVAGFAQAVLPASWSFATSTLPLGWNQTGIAYYSASGNTAPACKFDDTGDLLSIYFTGAPGILTYYIAGNSFANGTFWVEQSVDGNSWTSLHTFTATISSSYHLVTDTPQIATRFIRFNYFNKVAGNVGLDDVSIAAYTAPGTLASEPIAQASNLVFSNIKSYRFSAAYTPSVPTAEGYIVLRKTGSTITDVPIDGNTYQRGDMIGASKVVSSGNINSFVPNNIVANTSYYFAIFAYNGLGMSCNYLTTNPLTGAVTSIGSMEPPAYYSGIATSNATFIDDLHNKINPHTEQSYSNYGAKFLSTFIARDTTANQHAVTCVYSGENLLYKEPWNFTDNGFSREHTFCQSWMPTVNLVNFQTLPEYSDYHQLFPVNQNDANLVRSNFPLGEVVNVISTYLDAKFGTDKNGNQVYEPRNQHKGDAARALMYQAVCYNSVNGYNWKFPNPISNFIPYGQDQEILKKWHYQDLPDNYEIARNDFLDSLQHNRNPFVDKPEYACYIDFSNMTFIASPDIPCNTVGVIENKKRTEVFEIVPNPSKGNCMLTYTALKSHDISIKIIDTMGRIVISSHQQLSGGINWIELDIHQLNKGVYIVECINENEKQSQKLVID